MRLHATRVAGIAPAIGAVILLAGAFAQQARAAEPAKPTLNATVEQRFKNLDKNADGKVTPDEFTNAKEFKQFDINGDGFITLDEMKTFAAAHRKDFPAEERFQMLDKDANGKLSPAECPFPELFKAMDANNDGFVTLEEMKQYVAPPMTPELRFKQLDKNADGKITPEEFTNRDEFKRMDINGDGVITLDEMRQFFAQNMQYPMEPDARFKALDKNADGKLSPAEFTNAELFKKMDANTDGFVTLDEMKKFIAASQPPATFADRFKMSDKNNDGKLDAKEYTHADLFPKIDLNKDGFISMDEMKVFVANRYNFWPMTPEERIATLDKDADGKLSKTEFTNAELFPKIDANADGFITLEEMKKFFAQK